MEITVTELLLFIWAAFATIAAFYFHDMVLTAKRFTVHLLDDPQLYKDITTKINAHKEKQNGNSL